VAENDPHDEASGAQPKAPALPLDQLKIQAERRVATERLLARLKAIDATQDAQTTRALMQFHLHQPIESRLRLVVFDADHSNPDVCGKDGLTAGNGILST